MMSGSCQCSGVTDEEINHAQADNVDIATTEYFVGAKALGGHIDTHLFAQGHSKVKAVYTDYGGLRVSCLKELGCADKEPPTWTKMLDPEFEVDVGPSCRLNLGHVLKHYAKEEGIVDGIGKGAIDNCGLALSTVLVYSTRTGELVYNDSDTVAEAATLLGPGFFDVTFTATDTSGNSIKHNTELKLQDR